MGDVGDAQSLITICAPSWCNGASVVYSPPLTSDDPPADRAGHRRSRVGCVGVVAGLAMEPSSVRESTTQPHANEDEDRCKCGTTHRREAKVNTWRHPTLLAGPHNGIDELEKHMLVDPEPLCTGARKGDQELEVADLRRA